MSNVRSQNANQDAGNSLFSRTISLLPPPPPSRSACLLRKRVSQSRPGSMGQKPWAAPLCCSSPKSEGGNPGPGSGVTGLHGWGGTLSPPLATPPPGFLEVEQVLVTGLVETSMFSHQTGKRGVFTEGLGPDTSPNADTAAGTFQMTLCLLSSLVSEVKRKKNTQARRLSDVIVPSRAALGLKRVFERTGQGLSRKPH